IKIRHCRYKSKVFRHLGARPLRCPSRQMLVDLMHGKAHYIEVRSRNPFHTYHTYPVLRPVASRLIERLATVDVEFDLFQRQFPEGHFSGVVKLPLTFPGKNAYTRYHSVGMA